MKLRYLFSAGGLAAGWGLMLLSVALYLLFWRVDAEPGARKAPEMFEMAVFVLCCGAPLFVGNLVYLLVSRPKKALIVAAALFLVVSLLGCLACPLVLLMLV